MNWKLYDLDGNEKVPRRGLLGTAVMLIERFRPAPELPGVTPLPRPTRRVATN